MILLPQLIIVIVIIIIVVVVVVIGGGKDTISFMQGIYTYIPETNHVPKEYNVAAILSLLFMVPISLAPALALMYFLKYVRSAQYSSFLSFLNPAAPI
jgi:hypothetical protein